MTQDEWNKAVDKTLDDLSAGTPAERLSIVLPDDPITNLPDLADELEHAQNVLNDMFLEMRGRTGDTFSQERAQTLAHIIQRLNLAEQYADSLIETLATHMQGATL